MKSILEELFYGNVCPNTDCRNYEQDTKELMGDLSGHYDTLLKELNDKQKEILKKFDDCYSGLTDINQFFYKLYFLTMNKKSQGL